MLSALMPAPIPSSGDSKRGREPHRRQRGVVGLTAERGRDAPGDVRVVDRERSLDAGAEHRDVARRLPAPPRRPPRPG